MKIKFYVCEKCNNILTSMEDADISCCGAKISSLTPASSDDAHKINIEMVEDNWFLTSKHEMKKDHFILFVAFVSGDKITLIKQSPEWDLEIRLEKQKRGKIYAFCTKHGLSCTDVGSL